MKIKKTLKYNSKRETPANNVFAHNNSSYSSSELSRGAVFVCEQFSMHNAEATRKHIHTTITHITHTQRTHTLGTESRNTKMKTTWTEGARRTIPNETTVKAASRTANGLQPAVCMLLPIGCWCLWTCERRRSRTAQVLEPLSHIYRYMCIMQDDQASSNQHTRDPSNHYRSIAHFAKHR